VRLYRKSLHTNPAQSIVYAQCDKGETHYSHPMENACF
jgi:hypothetical protein